VLFSTAFVDFMGNNLGKHTDFILSVTNTYLTKTIKSEAVPYLLAVSSSTSTVSSLEYLLTILASDTVIQLHFLT